MIRALLQATSIALLVGLSPAARASQTVREAAIVSLNRDDLQALAQGLKESIFGVSTTRGELTSRPGQGGLGGFEFDRLRYQLDVPSVALVPGYDRLTFRAEIRNLSVSIDRVFIDRTWTRHCRNLRVTSLSSGIPIEVVARPQMDGPGRLKVSFERVTIGLARHNFYFHGVSSCDILGPIDPFIERMIPQIANTMQGEIRRMMEAQVAGLVDMVNRQIGDLFETELALPITRPPLGRATIRLKTFPWALAIDEYRAAIVLGIRTLAPPARALAPEPLIRLRRPHSFVGVTAPFVDALLYEASRLGVFRVTVDGSTQPDLGPYFKAQLLHDLMPDAWDRFDAEEPIAFRLLDAALRVEPRAVPGEPGLPFDVVVDGMSGVIDVSARPYYNLGMTGRLPLRLDMDRRTQRVSLTVESLLGMTLGAHGFVPGLTPPPEPDSGLDPEMFQELVALLDEVLAGGEEPLVSMRLPNLRLGNTWVQYWDLTAVGPTMLMDLRLRRL